MSAKKGYTYIVARVGRVSLPPPPRSMIAYTNLPPKHKVVTDTASCEVVPVHHSLQALRLGRSAQNKAGATAHGASVTDGSYLYPAA